MHCMNTLTLTNNINLGKNTALNKHLYRNTRSDEFDTYSWHIHLLNNGNVKDYEIDVTLDCLGNQHQNSWVEMDT